MRKAKISSFVATALTLLVVDALWIGLIAKELFDGLIGPLLVVPVRWFPALLFYVMYITAIQWHAVLKAHDIRDSLRRGCALGFVCYGTYELTNWAILKNWPPAMVAVDMTWGITITGVSAMVGKWFLDRFRDSQSYCLQGGHEKG